MTDMQALHPELFARNKGTDNQNPADIGFWSLVAEDFRTHKRQFASQGFWALFWHRFGNWRMGIKFRLLRMPFSLIYRIMFKLTEIICGIHLPYTVRVGRRVRLDHFGGMVLVAHSIGNDVTIRQNTTFGIAGLDNMDGRPIIGDRVEVGAGVVILGGVHVGGDAIIGANAVVNRDVVNNTVVGGVPARVLRDRRPANLKSA